MLTVAEETLQQLAEDHGKEVTTHLYGQEINAETYAICKADLLLKGEGDAADNIVGGPEYSTLSNDAFRSREFDFMFRIRRMGRAGRATSNAWAGRMGSKTPDFIIEHAGDPEYSLLTRSSDGQMLFLANMLSKMKHGTKLGSRIAEVHNGSSLFTGDAGQGESNIRRWIIENDWLEAIVALPLNMFYNTGIATYIWVLTNRKRAHRKGKVQLIDATSWFKPLRKNLGKKNCELSDADIDRIAQTLPRLQRDRAIEDFRQCRLWILEGDGRAAAAACGIDARARVHAERDQSAAGRACESTKTRPRSSAKFTRTPSPIRCTALFEATIRASAASSNTSRTPICETPNKCRSPRPAESRRSSAARCCLMQRTPGWIEDSTKIGYEISFTRYFYKPQPLRTLEEIRSDILALEKETEGLLEGDRRGLGMIDGLKPYPAMKDSGVPWLGEVPEHWEVRKLRTICS